MIAKTRRQFVQIFPLVGLGLLAGCGDQKPASVAATPAAPAPPPPAPAPAPAPVAAAATATPAPAAPAGNLPMVAADDATAVSLGYVSDETKVDKVKYAQHVAGNRCGNCALFQGAASTASGPCPLFPGKQVSAAGWCSAYVKKAA